MQYNMIQKINTVADLKTGSQYVFVQETGKIAIWLVENEVKSLFPTDAVKQLAKYYKKNHGRNLDTMIKKLLTL